MSITYDLLEMFKNDGDDVPEFAFKWSGMDRDERGDPILGNDRFTTMLSHGLSIDRIKGDLKGWKNMLMHYFASSCDRGPSSGESIRWTGKQPVCLTIPWSYYGAIMDTLWGKKLHITKFALWDPANQVNFFIKDPRNPQSAENPLLPAG